MERTPNQSFREGRASQSAGRPGEVPAGGIGGAAETAALPVAVRSYQSADGESFTPAAVTQQSPLSAVVNLSAALFKYAVKCLAN